MFYTAAVRFNILNQFSGSQTYCVYYLILKLKMAHDLLVNNKIYED